MRSAVTHASSALMPLQLQCLLHSVLLLLPLPMADHVVHVSDGETVGDRLWMWAHPAGFHDPYFSAARGFHPENGPGRPGAHTWRSRITPVEAAVRMDLRNIMFVYENAMCAPRPVPLKQ